MVVVEGEGPHVVDAHCTRLEHCTRLDLSADVPTVVVELGEWLDVSTAPAVEATVDRALAAHPPTLVVDLAGCPAADAYGVHALARLHAQAQRQGTSLVLTGVSPQVRRVLHLLGHDDELPAVVDPVAAAARG